jgi:NTP pyrophosphatase (non-canonical NTP hydrolase)
VNFDQYQAEADSTAIFPPLYLAMKNVARSFSWGYPLIGIAGEASELLEALQKVSEAGEKSPELAEALIAESGDLLWYIAAYSTANGFSLNEIAKQAIDEKQAGPLDIRDFEAHVARQIDLEESGFELMRAITSLFNRNRIGAIMEESKRILRDDRLARNDERSARIKTALGKTLVTLATICNGMGISLDEVATSNIEKLKSRQERGKLQGSGDYR